MPSLTIKDLPAPLWARLRQRAVADRRSLNREVIHLLERTRGTSPVVLAKLRQVASNVLGVTVCTQYDWRAMEAAVAARARHLPLARRVVRAA